MNQPDKSEPRLISGAEALMNSYNMMAERYALIASTLDDDQYNLTEHQEDVLAKTALAIEAEWIIDPAMRQRGPTNYSDLFDTLCEDEEDQS